MRIAVLLAVLFLPFLAGAEAASQKSEVLAEAGEALFQQHCSSCHGIDGRGKGPAAEVLRVPPADLTRIAARRGGTFPDLEIAAFIDGRRVLSAHGTREMPIWGYRFGEKIHEEATEEEVIRGKLLVLVDYLKSLQRPTEAREN